MIGIYFLLKQGKVIYIGQTTNIIVRLKAHKNKLFDSYRFIECSRKDLSRYERRWIKKFDPELNGNAGPIKTYKKKRVWSSEFKKNCSLSIMVKPSLLKVINEKTKDLNRNQEIEALLEQKYL